MNHETLSLLLIREIVCSSQEGPDQEFKRPSRCVHQFSKNMSEDGVVGQRDVDVSGSGPDSPVQTLAAHGEPAPRKGKNNIYCRVPECRRVLNGLKRYHKRYRICPDHLKMSHVVLDGVDSRFCQLCGKFQPLGDFDGAKRSCRAKLARHNERRHKSRVEIIVDACTDTCQPGSCGGKREPGSTNHGGGVLPQQLPQRFWAPSTGYTYQTSSRDNYDQMKREEMPVDGANPGRYSRPSVQLPHPSSQDMGILFKTLLPHLMVPRPSMNISNMNEESAFERYTGNSQGMPSGPEYYHPGPFGHGQLGQYQGFQPPFGRFQQHGTGEDDPVQLLMRLLECLSKG